MSTLLLALLSVGSEARAESPPPHRFWYSHSTFARYNPLGLIDTTTLGWRRRLMESDSVLFEDTWLLLGASARLSPAFGRLGLHAEVQPIALFKAWADVEGVGYFGTFDQITSFPTADVAYDDATLEALGAGEATGGWVMTVGAVLQAKAGPVAIRSAGQATRYDLAGADAFFYDQFWDRLAPNGSMMFLHDLDVLGVGEHARVGARWTWSDSVLDAPGTDAALAHHRLGPMLAWQFHERGPGTRFDKPTVFVLAQWWLQHPYRTGAEQPQGLPLVAAGFAFQGDLLP